jgi:hypothetical protein
LKRVCNSRARAQDDIRNNICRRRKEKESKNKKERYDKRREREREREMIDN